MTNAVKHFNWEPRGKRRMHKKPNAAEIRACRPWLQAEIALVQPAGHRLPRARPPRRRFIGPQFRITQSRGEALDGAPVGGSLVATYHPSALLRMMDDRAAYAKAKAEFESDLRKKPPRHW